MTMSVGDLLDDWFENDALKGAYASTGVVGVWAGPRTPGTAYNLLHHELGELDGVGGAWGHVRGGMGAISRGASRPARRARRRGRPHRRGGRVDRRARAARVTGVTLAGGETLHAPHRPLRRAPEDDRARPRRRRALPATRSSTDMRRYRTRGGSVKVNCDPARAAAVRGRVADEAEALLHTSLAICPSVDYLERAWQDADARRAGRRARTSRSRCRRRSTRR